MKYEIINGATYVSDKTNPEKYCSICKTCLYKEQCDEPSKERRISCTKEKMNSFNKKEK